MKEYLKMSDGFDADEAAIEQRLFSGLICKEEATYAAHAIASHDELVEMNKELLAALEFAKSALEGSYDVNEWPGDGSSTCDKAISVAEVAITKANGGAA